MQPFDQEHLELLANSYSNLQDKLNKATEDISLIIETNESLSNFDYLVQLLECCNQAMADAKSLAIYCNLYRQQRDKLQGEVKSRENELVRLLQQNQALTASLQEVRNNYDIFVAELEGNYERNRQIIQTEARTQIEEKQANLRTCLQSELKRYQQIFQSKSKENSHLLEQLASIQHQNRLLQDQIQLAEIAVSDIWNKIEQPLPEKHSNLWDTYSPSPNSSESSIRLSASNLIDLNRKRGSLMQDFFDSEITYNEPLLGSKLQLSKQTIEQINGELDQNIVITDQSYNRFSPASSSSSSKCINCRFKSLLEKHKVTNSVGTQAYDETFVRRVYKWFKAAIIDDRIKKQ